MRIAAKHGDGQSVQRSVVGRFHKPARPTIARCICSPAPDSAIPGIIDRALHRTLSTEVRTQDAGRYLAAFFENPVARSRAWSFVKTNWTELEPKLRMSNSAGVRDASARRVSAMRARAKTSGRSSPRKRLPGVNGALNQAVERINNCIDLQVKQKKAGQRLAGRAIAATIRLRSDHDPPTSYIIVTRP